MQAVSTVPGVTAVGTADRTLADGVISGNNIYLPGDPRELFNIGDLYSGCPGWAELIGVDIIEGRNFTNPKEIIVDPDFRERLIEVTTESSANRCSLQNTVRLEMTCSP